MNYLHTYGVNQIYNSSTFPDAGDRDIGEIARHVMTTYIEPNTDVVYDATLIVAAGFTATDVRFDRVSAKKAIEQLADMAQNYVYGVNALRKFYFKALDTTVNANAVRFVGKTIGEFDVSEEDVNNVLNDIDIVSGLITDGSNYIATVSDAYSQELYGKRWGKLTIPEVLSINDATQWGEYQLEKYKDPQVSAKCTDVSILNYTKVEATGKARVFDINGVKYELYIKKVTYKISGSGGISMDWELGNITMPIEQQIIDILRKVRDQEVLQASNVAQLS